MVSIIAAMLKKKKNINSNSNNLHRGIKFKETET